jgi:hypothetical protein
MHSLHYGGSSVKAEQIAHALDGKPNGSGFMCRCPVHDDNTASLKIDDGPNGLLVHCHAGCEQRDVIAGLRDRGLWPVRTDDPLPRAVKGASDITYDYVDATGALIYQVLRKPGKQFRQRQPDGQGGWTWNLKGIAPLPYRLPQLIAAIKTNVMVAVVEGEKDADNLVAAGIPATCNSGGAGKWRPQFAEYFRGADVVILPDNDEPGRAHAEQVAANIAPVSRSVRVLKLPGLQPKGDVSDWLAAGDGDQLSELGAGAPLWVENRNLPCLEGLTAAIPPDRRELNEAVAVATFALLWYSAMESVVHQQQLVKGLLLAGSLVVVFGESNTGKTFWILQLALVVASGARWRGRRVHQGLVIYVAGEGAASVRARVAAYRKEHPESTDLPFAIIAQPVDFLSPESIAALIATIRGAESACGSKAVLIVIDTFSRAMPGGDQNSAQDVGGVVANADLIRTEIGACVAFIHHAGKDPAKGARGSSALRAAADTEVLIEGTTGTRTATVTKQRDLECGAVMPFELVPVDIGNDPDDNTPITSCVVKQLDAETTAAPVLQELRGKNQRRFIESMRVRAESDPESIWTIAELRAVARELGMGKSAARYVVDTVTMSPYMTMTVGGYFFTDGVGQGTNRGNLSLSVPLDGGKQMPSPIGEAFCPSNLSPDTTQTGIERESA